MAKVTSKIEMSNLKTVEDVVRYLTPVLKDIASQVNGNLGFSDNIFNTVVGVTFTAANVPLQVPHNLGRPPIMWLSGNNTTHGVVYQTQPPDSSLLYLASSAVMSAKILVI